MTKWAFLLIVCSHNVGKEEMQAMIHHKHLNTFGPINMEPLWRIEKQCDSAYIDEEKKNFPQGKMERHIQVFF